MPPDQDLRLEIDGMSCAACAGRAERALSTVPGIGPVSVNFASRSGKGVP